MQLMFVLLCAHFLSSFSGTSPQVRLPSLSNRTVFASRDLVRRPMESDARRSLVRVPHNATAAEPTKRRMIPPSTNPIFFPILIFDMDVIVS